MSGDPIIRVENLGKKYVIGHQAERQHYVALRDVISGAARRMLSGRRTARTSQEDFWALKDVSFEVQAGEVLGVIGRNGAGKSTLLKILSRITEPSEGRATLMGRVSSLLEVGTGFHPELTGRENIYLNGAILGMSHAEIRRKFDEIVAFAEIEKFLDTPVKHYSSGMYVRLAFAVAAHLEPEILVVDEVLAVGDAEFQKKCLGKMSEVAGGGRTVLFVSHNMAAVENLCQKAIVLEKGQIRCFASTAEALSIYLQMQHAADPDADFSHQRPSWARPCIERVSLLDRSGVARNNFALGETVMVEIAFASAAARIRRPVMGVVINHATRGTIGGVSTRMTGFNPAADSYSAGIYRCRLNEMSLLQGQYTVDIWLGDGPSDIDTIPGAATFTVEEGDVYNSGITPFHNMGVIFLKPDWEFKGVTECINAQPS